MNKLSVVVITFNEEIDLPKCLSTVKKIADEIIVVDSGSADNTLQIAKNFGAKTYFRKFDNYSNQKNYAMSKANGDWILSIDADEELEPELAKEILEKLRSNNSKFTAYSIPRKNIIFGKEIKYTRWQSELDRHIWLWKKGAGKWVGDVHEELKVAGDVGSMKYAKIHNQYKTVKEFLDMINRYSELEAEKKVKSGQGFSYFRFFFDPKYNFFVRYIYRLGFLDGWRGFVLSYLMGVYHFVLWVKVWDKTTNSAPAENKT
jgi:glycosyltransferase involved in cell wall biosynthesis